MHILLCQDSTAASEIRFQNQRSVGKAFLQFLGTLPIMQSKIGPPFFLVPFLLLEKKNAFEYQKCTKNTPAAETIDLDNCNSMKKALPDIKDDRGSTPIFCDQKYFSSCCY